MVDGRPQGLRLIDRPGWTGSLLIAPRADFSALQSREEVRRTGVYVLTGPDADGDRTSRIYVGESDDVRRRLDDHQANKDFWTQALVITTSDLSLNKAHVRYLEARLLQIAAEARNAALDNGTAPAPPHLDEQGRAQMESFLESVVPLFALSGVDAFDVVSRRAEPRPGPQQLSDVTLRLTSSGCDARGRMDSRGFIVFAESTGRAPAVDSMASSYAALRSRLKDDGVFVVENDTLRFVRDHVFSSPSAAADVLIGGSRNGRLEWKHEDGRTLKDLQEAEARADLQAP